MPGVIANFGFKGDCLTASSIIISEVFIVTGVAKFATGSVIDMVSGDILMLNLFLKLPRPGVLV